MFARRTTSFFNRRPSRPLIPIILAGALLTGCGSTPSESTGDSTTNSATPTSGAEGSATDAQAAGSPSGASPTHSTSPSPGKPSLSSSASPESRDTQPSAGKESGAQPFPSSLPFAMEPVKGSELRVIEARIGQHRGFDRLVIELSGQGRPGWTLKTTKQPFADGSGFPVEYSGKTALVVALHYISMPQRLRDGSFYDPPLRGNANGNAIQSVKDQGAFEAVHQYVLGLRDENPRYKINYLQSPPRVVIDVEKG
ncbi:AMIN-like domain-containing (lipo)protein [Corynebacterium auriscanis]|uniref:AMIN-like domain-containing (lipo)protein n=1 Tax=Corynebacterium auriscanis TaxID=99807 RepID=UPI003CF38622